MTTIATLQFTGSDEQTQYTLTLGSDGRLACSCPSFTFRGDCTHTSWPVSRQFARYYVNKTRPSQRVRLVELYPAEDSAPAYRHAKGR